MKKCFQLDSVSDELPFSCDKRMQHLLLLPLESKGTWTKLRNGAFSWREGRKVSETQVNTREALAPSSYWCKQFAQTEQKLPLGSSWGRNAVLTSSGTWLSKGEQGFGVQLPSCCYFLLHHCTLL